MVLIQKRSKRADFEPPSNLRLMDSLHEVTIGNLLAVGVGQSSETMLSARLTEIFQGHIQLLLFGETLEHLVLLHKLAGIPSVQRAISLLHTETALSFVHILNFKIVVVSYKNLCEDIQ